MFFIDAVMALSCLLLFDFVNFHQRERPAFSLSRFVGLPHPWSFRVRVLLFLAIVGTARLCGAATLPEHQTQPLH